MSRLSLTSLLSLRALAISAAVVAASGLVASPAQATFSTSLGYRCDLPQLGEQPLVVSYSAELPSAMTHAPGSAFSTSFKLSASATLGESGALAASGAKTFEGVLTPSISVDGPGYLTMMDAPLTLPKQLVNAAADVNLGASAQSPSVAIPVDGPATFSYSAVRLSILARDAGGDPIQLDGGSGPGDSPWTFDVRCTLAPPEQDTTLGVVSVLEGDDVARGRPGKPSVSDVTKTSATLSWGASSWETAEAPRLGGYDLFSGDTRITATFGTATSTKITGLTPDTNYTFTVKAKDTDGFASEASEPVTFLTAGATSVDYSYALQGAATMKTLIVGSMPVDGSLTARLDLLTGAFTGNLALVESSATLLALDFLPVTARLAVVPSTPMSGQLIDGKLRASAKVRIKLRSAKLFGLELLAGSSCQARLPTNLALKSSDAVFDPLVGGPLSATFSLSDLTGCTGLGGVVSPLTKGTSNAIALQLSPLPSALP